MKDKLISEDDERRSLEDIQKLTDSYMQKLEAAVKSKEKDIMEVK
jgi:ribosome recycling factor